ncbi:MAG: OmpH family outer membrane protein [Nitrospirae bacterium]|nr:OmpH family outer membrane protein [Nitrospirota bacterium]
MKRFLTFGIIGVFMAMSAVAASAAEPLKIGVVDLYKALNESESGKKAKSNLESLIKSKQAAIEEKQKNIEKLKADFDKKAAAMSSEVRKSKEDEIERLFRDYQRMVTDSQTELKKKETEMTGGILKELREIINNIAKEEKFTLVIERADGIVLYVDSSIDITKKVLNKLNQTKKK